MESSHLRIGNWYNEFGIPKQVTAEFILKLHDIESNGKIVVDVSPIQLTEEWLIKLGATQYKERKDMFNLRGITVVIDKDGDLMCIKGNLICELILCHLKYVHQLQNFYFAFTGQELNIIEGLSLVEK